MNKDIIKGKWKEIKGNLKKQFGKLTDDDLAQINGSYEELSGRLQKAYGYNKDRIDKEIDTFLTKYRYTEKME